MSTYQTILNDLTTAMKEKDQVKLTTLRSLKAKLLETEIAERKGGEASLSEDQVIAVLMKAAKQRKESIDQFEQANRTDLVAKEQAELEVIEHYLPKMMSEEELTPVIQDIITQTGASSIKEMGKVMGMAMGKLKGKADGNLINKVVKSLLE